MEITRDRLEAYRPRRGEDQGEWFVAEGRWVVDALLEQAFEIESVVVAAGQHEDLVTRIPAGVPVLRPEKEALQDALGFTFNRGVLARARRPAAQRLNGIDDGLIVICPELADASNLGAIIRCSAAFGAAGVAVEKGKGASPYARKAIRASSGTVFRTRVWESPELLADVHALQKEGWQVIGTALDPRAVPLWEAAHFGKTLLVLGGEGSGLGAEWMDTCDILATLPMAAGVDSMNVATSAAVALYEFLGRPT